MCTTVLSATARLGIRTRTIGLITSDNAVMSLGIVSSVTIAKHEQVMSIIGNRFFSYWNLFSYILPSTMALVDTKTTFPESV